ncbi:MAG TPA: hypothetical protein VF525_10945 [Pyrinomonadaceae bacterium]|jgi:hypothetical protein
MSQAQEGRRETKQYLLGGLPPDALRALEERLMTDPAYLEELSVCEDELIDDYLRDALAPGEREQFERHFMATPARQQKLRFARTFRRYVAAHAPAPLGKKTEHPNSARLNFRAALMGLNPRVGLALAAGLLLCVLGGSWLLFRQGPNTDDIPRAGARIVAVELSPGLTRADGELTRASVPAGTDYVQLRLALPVNEYQSYRGEIIAADGRVLLTRDDLKAEQSTHGPVVVLNRRAGLLPPGDYRVRLSGLRPPAPPESLATYALRLLP